MPSTAAEEETAEGADNYAGLGIFKKCLSELS